MSSPLGLTVFSATSTTDSVTATQSDSTSDVQQNTKPTSSKNKSGNTSNYTYNGYKFNKYSSAPNVTNAKRSIFSGKVGFKTKFEHSNDIYDIRTNEIIKYSNQYPAMKLKAEDFAYLRNLGVYSNNRLIVVRRFPAPVGNDLTRIKSSPLATMVSWIPDTEKDILSVQFGEVWTEAEASLKKVLNDIGDDITLNPANRTGGGGQGLGNMLSVGLNALPLPGFMEGVQLEILNTLGFTENGSKSIPSGNPNIIKEAKVRKTIAKDEPGSGLKCKISIKFETEYEQKFIDGVDPTLVYYDIISSALRFGTSESRFIINSKAQSTAVAIVKKIQAGKWIEAIGMFVDAIIVAITKIKDAMIAKIGEVVEKVEKAAEDANLKQLANEIFDAFLKNAANTIISKYRVRLGGIMSALSGEASTPWHVTIGNPKKPIFSSGDMLVDEVTVDLGNVLSFNDLPSNVKISFTLTNARALGAQEVFERFNTGAGRSYVVASNSFEEHETKTKSKK